MADGRYFQQPLNCHNSATAQWMAMKFGTLTHFDPLKRNND